ncbi:RhuM family protein [Enterocloster aldenensis]|uniref:RhuM family protein n=1 Tax=Enterocloster aldenensis TaxID=358742 RepID=UPI001F375EF9
MAKNYLNGQELDELNKIFTACLDIAKVQALNHEPMYMRYWAWVGIYLYTGI